MRDKYKLLQIWKIWGEIMCRE